MRCERCGKRDDLAGTQWLVSLGRKDEAGLVVVNDELRLCEKCARTVFGSASKSAFGFHDRRLGVE